MTLTGIIATISTLVPLEDEHAHAGDFWVEFTGLLTDPAHLAFEFVFSLVFDFLLIPLIYGVLIQRVLIPRLRKSLHDELDKEHGVEHPEPEPKTSTKQRKNKNDG